MDGFRQKSKTLSSSEKFINFLFKNKHFHRISAIVISILAWSLKIYDFTQTIPAIILYILIFITTIMSLWVIWLYFQDWR